MAEILVAMSGGVDSSVAAALLLEQGHTVTGVTLKLWGGPSDSGCCSVADVDDARRVADQLGIQHHVFNFGDDFDTHVVAPYVEAHAQGRTPNPCIECNRHLKFDKLLRRATALGFDQVATGHHARIADHDDGTRRLRRGADHAKDQSYVLFMLGQSELARLHFPVGDLDKTEVRARAASLGLRTADKPDSQDVCFITATGGRHRFLDGRLDLTPGRVVDTRGRQVGEVPAVQLVTIGQRKGLGVAGSGRPQYAVDVDPSRAVVTIGSEEDLLVSRTELTDVTWAAESAQHTAGPWQVQASAHGPVVAARLVGTTLQWAEPRRRVAPGQSLVFYADDQVAGGAQVAA